MKNNDESLDLFPIAIMLIAIIVLFAFVVSCSKKPKDPPHYEREVTQLEGDMFCYDILTNYLAYKKLPYSKIDGSRITDTNYIIGFIDSFEASFPEKYNKTVYYMPSGASLWVYVSPTNEPHPCDLFDSGKISIFELYDKAIGNFYMCVPTNYIRSNK